MKIPFLDLKRLHSSIADELDKVSSEVIRGGWFVGGKLVETFEGDFANYLNASHCISCGNGTDAMELILEALEIGEGDEVIVPSFTWVSDAEVILRRGATPVYVDLPNRGYNIIPATIASHITKDTKAILVVHLFGVPCDMHGILDLARSHGLKVIEDCAQAHGANIGGKKVGTFGDAAAFSFYPTKNLGALGDGGAVVTNSKSLADEIRLLADHGQESRDNHLLVGRNSRLDSLQAAILSLKLKHLDQWNEERKSLAYHYFEGLKDCNIKLPASAAGRVYHLFTIQVERRDELKSQLEKSGIITAIHYPKPIHKIAAYRSSTTLPNAEEAARQILSLPLYPGLTVEEVGFVIEEIRRFE